MPNVGRSKIHTKDFLGLISSFILYLYCMTIISTTVDKIDDFFYKFIKEAVMTWVEGNAKVQFQEILDIRTKYDWNEGQVIYHEIMSNRYHEVEVSEDGMSAVYKKRKSYLFFGVALDKDLDIKVEFPERIVPALPLKYKHDTHFTTVHEARMIRKGIIDKLSEPI
jgi:hypothetical protein